MFAQRCLSLPEPLRLPRRSAQLPAVRLGVCRRQHLPIASPQRGGKSQVWFLSVRKEMPEAAAEGVEDSCQRQGPDPDLRHTWVYAKSPLRVNAAQLHPGLAQISKGLFCTPARALQAAVTSNAGSPGWSTVPCPCPRAARFARRRRPPHAFGGK